MFESVNHFVYSEALIGLCKWKENNGDFQFLKYLRASSLTISKSSNQNKHKEVDFKIEQQSRGPGGVCEL